ncbi:hypothetical protein L9F63_000439 [Diploptera punctata]|uniref:Uncharacterized protein n=1 Tax=Diploptera punctata TaxID=6984 RepID=A0AAD8ALM2_DIPPU|nr:hypothetical protein L9F63_000439 [Diploptera punctata]
MAAPQQRAQTVFWYATFYVSISVNRHNVRIWGTQNPHVYREHVQDIPKVNV